MAEPMSAERLEEIRGWFLGQHDRCDVHASTADECDQCAVGDLIAELAAARPIVEAARAWREARKDAATSVFGMHAFHSATSALIAAVDASARPTTKPEETRPDA